MKKKLSILFVSSLFVLCSCGDPYASQLNLDPNDSGEINTPWVENDNGKRVESITLSSDNLNLKPTETSPLTATIEPGDAFNKDLTWSTPNNDVATFENGVVTAVANGDTSIKFSSDNNVSATCNIKVRTPLESLTIDPKELTLDILDSEQLSVIPIPSTASNPQVAWSSDLPSDLKQDIQLSDSGLITVTIGRIPDDIVFHVTATSVENDEIYDTITVTIHDSNVYADRIEFDQTSPINLEINQSLKINATVYSGTEEITSKKQLNWTSSNSSLVSVDSNGLISCLKAGSGDDTVTIKAEVDGVNKTVDVKPFKNPVTSITFEESSGVVLRKGEKTTLHASVNEEASIKTIRYEVDELAKDYVSVGTDGTLTGLKSTPIGDVYKVWAISCDDETIKEYCAVQVVNPAESFTATVDKNVIYYGTVDNVAKLNIVATPADADDMSFTITSSDDTLATISNRNIIANNSNKTGTVTITVTADARPDLQPQEIEIEIKKPAGKFDSDKWYLVGNRDFNNETPVQDVTSWDDSDYAAIMQSSPDSAYYAQYKVTLDLESTDEFKIRSNEWVNLIRKEVGSNEAIEKQVDEGINFRVNRDGKYVIYLQITEIDSAFVYQIYAEELDTFYEGRWYVVGDHDYSTGVSKEGESWNSALKSAHMVNYEDGKFSSKITFNANDQFRLRSKEYPSTSINVGGGSADKISKSSNNFVVNEAGIYNLYYVISENTVYVEKEYVLTGIELDHTEEQIQIGKKLTINVSPIPSQATLGEIEWDSSDEDVATVTAGVVSAVAIGTAEITATVKGTEISKKCNIEVVADPVTKTVYFETASWWNADGAVSNVYYWGTDDDTDWPGVKMTKVDETTWKFDIPVDATGFLFVRASEAGADWGAKTVDLSFAQMGQNDMYSISSTSPVWGDPGVTGVWKKR